MTGVTAAVSVGKRAAIFQTWTGVGAAPAAALTRAPR